MTDRERAILAADVLTVAAARPWRLLTFTDDGETYEDVRTQDGDAIIVQGERCFLPVQETANLRLVVAAVNEHEAHLDGEEFLRGVLGYFRGFDQERGDRVGGVVGAPIFDGFRRLVPEDAS